MKNKVKSIKRGQWLINYELENNKVIILNSAFKAFCQKGWWERREQNVLVSSGRR